MSFFYKYVEKLVNSNSEYLDAIYNAISKDDSSEAVLAALVALGNTKSIPKVNKAYKSDQLSIPCRETGNSLFKIGDFTNALKMYNLAIGSALKGSQPILLAYSNRSALFQKVKAYSAALKDIETSLAMECSSQLEEKLKLRREECRRLVSQEIEHKNSNKCDVGKDFFTFAVDRNPEIPCVSSFVDVVVENQSPKVVAAKTIPVGSIVAIETPFASNLDSENYCNACHYCHKFVLNLIPCDTCCETFFCSNSCKEICYNQYHNIECQLIDLLKLAFPEDRYRISFKAALKMKMMSKTWDDLITAISNSLDKPTHNLKKEIYNSNSIYSMLCTSGYKHFVFGQKCTQSLVVATLVHHLGKIPGFFPISHDSRMKAICAFSKIMMHLIPLDMQVIMVQNAALVYPMMKVSVEPEANSGIFSFTSKLKHACEPNLLVVGLDQKVALVAIRTIVQGTELSVSFIGHWFDQNYTSMRATRLLEIKPACQCRVCAGRWSTDSVVDGNTRMNQKQKNFIFDWFMLRMVAGSSTNATRRLLNDTLKGLDMFRDKPNTKQYLALYEEFRKMLCLWQYMYADHSYVLVSKCMHVVMNK